MQGEFGDQDPCNDSTAVTKELGGSFKGAWG